MVAVEQSYLDIEVEDYTRRQKWLIEHLRDYRTIDADIAVQRRLMDGVGLVHEPRITAAAPERDYMEWITRVGYDKTDGEQVIIESMKRHLNQADFAIVEKGHIKLIYATRARVSRRLSGLDIEDDTERQAVDDAVAILTEHQEEEYLHLTDIEKAAEKRLQEREEAEVEYDKLTARKEIIGEALGLMEQYHYEGYLILWHKFVQGETRERVCRIASRDHADLTVDEYRLARNKALKQFSKWVVGLR